MAVVCPTVTATDSTIYRAQLEHIQPFAHRIHLDIMDGVLAPVRSVTPDQLWWQRGPKVDIHVMYQKPKTIIEELIALQPDMVILHAKADDLRDCFQDLHDVGIGCGIALLPDESADLISPHVDQIEHVLIFSGNLGHFGGKADFGLLDKVAEIKAIKSDLEIGWDGGINQSNVNKLVEGGVDVLNVGGFIQKSNDPENAYDTLVTAITNKE